MNYLKTMVIAFSLFSSTLFGAVNINTANAEELAAGIKGVGQSKAAAIVAYREENGEFKTIEELVNVRGIGLKTVEKNREELSTSSEKK